MNINDSTITSSNSIIVNVIDEFYVSKDLLFVIRCQAECCLLFIFPR